MALEHIIITLAIFTLKIFLWDYYYRSEVNATSKHCLGSGKCPADNIESVSWSGHCLKPAT